jgi:leader peptidase (prepilin peptidase) / N-methyltransferase
MSPALLAEVFPYALTSVFVFLFGACIGSFLNVCIYRVPREMSVVVPRSHCPQCNRMIAWYDNIPLLSYILLRARCRHCGTHISARYVLVELLVAVLFLLAWLKFDFSADTSRALGLAAVTDWKLVVVYWLAISGLVLGTFVDFEHMIIPDRVSLGGIVTGVALSALLPALHDAATVKDSVFASALGAAVGWGSLWAVAIVGQLIFRKEAMGFGDVKLLGAIGAYLGWRGVLFAIVGSSFVGSMVGLILVFSGKKELQSRIPYGPYLALAAIVWMYWGPALWDRYLHLITPTM